MTRRALLLAVAGSLLLPVALGPVPSATAATAATAAELEIGLTAMTPAAVTPRTPLVVTGTVTNTGGTAAAAPRVALDLRTGVLGSREEVSTWVADGRGSGSTRELPGAATLPRLEPGASAAFRITVPAGGLDLGRREADFGPRGIVVRGTDNGAEAARLRTTTVWYPVKRFSPTKLSLLVPVTAALGSDAGAPTAAAAAELAPEGRLGRLLAATADPAVAWALDPALLAVARRLRDDGAEPGEAGAAPTSTPSPDASTPTEEQRATGADWLARVRTGRSGRDVFGLPFADTDVTSVTRAGGRDLLGTADALGRQASTAVPGTPPAGGLAWPAQGQADPATLGVLAAAGRTEVVLAAGAQPPTGGVSYTTTGRSAVPYQGGSMRGLLYDEGLSALFAATGGEQGVAAGQQLVAELAAITMERPGDPRHVLAVAPRGWNPDPQGVQRAVAALRGSPWVSVLPLSDLIATAPAEEPRAAPGYPESARRAELPASHVGATVGIRRQILGFGPALADPEPVVDPLLERDVSLVSTAWRANRLQLGAARAPLAREANDLSRGVHIVRGSQRPYLLASEADLPVYVANGTPYPVQVQVQLRPRSGRMQVTGAVPVDLPPDTRRQQVLVPVEALSSGDVQMDAVLLAVGGEELPGTERTLTVRVRREWETRGLIGAGLVLGLLLVVGLLRGVRRDRTRVRPEDVPDVDDLATAGGDRASARMDALDPLATGELPVLRPGLLDAPRRPATTPGTNDVAPPQNGPQVGPVPSSEHADDDEGDAQQDARERPVMSKEQQ